MNKKWILVALVLILFIALNQACKTENDNTSRNENLHLAVNTDMSISQMVKRGEYLVTVAGCNDCHSPKVFTDHGPVPDETRLLSGHPADMPVAAYKPQMLKDWVLFNPHLTAAAGPWGISFSANLTSDDTGIGRWSEEQFIRALREGKYKGLANSRPLLPPMPWPNYAQMKDEDLKAIFAYLKSTKPVRNIVPAPVAPPATVGMK